MRYKKRLLVVPLMVALGIGAGLASADSSPTPPVPVVVQTAVPPYTAPTGPVMAPTSAERFALIEAQRAGDSAPVVVSQMEGTFEEAHAVLSHHGEILESPETKEWLRSETYMTVMHGHFTARLVAPGQTPVSGSVMVVITDAHTGEAEGEYIGPTTPVDAALQPVAAADAEASASPH